jgi:hypothetical protein
VSVRSAFLNDDRIVAGAEWPLHPHRDIESSTHVVEGHFLHDDSLGNNGHLEPGAAQVGSFVFRFRDLAPRSPSVRASRPLRQGRSGVFTFL